MSLIFRLFFFGFFIAFPVFAAETRLDDGQTDLHWKILADPEERLSVEQVFRMRQASEWQPLGDNAANFGFDTTPYWFLTRLSVGDIGRNQALLVIGNPLLDHIDTYLVSPEGQVLQHFEVGDSKPFAERPVIHADFILPLALQPNSEFLLIMRVKTSSSFQVPTELYLAKTLWEKIQIPQLASGFFIGLLWVMALFYLILFVRIKDYAFLYFAGAVTFFSFTELAMQGYSYQFLWPKAVAWNNATPLFFVALSSASLAFFVKHFLKLSQFSPFWRNTCNFLGSAMLVLAAAAVVFPFRVIGPIVITGVVITPITYYLLSFFLMLRGHRPARLFFIGFSVYVLAAIIFISSKHGLIPQSPLTDLSLYLGSMLIVLSFSAAIAAKVLEQRDKTQRAQQQAIEHLKKYETLYESSLEGMFRATVDGRCMSLNPSMAALLNIQSADDKEKVTSNIYAYLLPRKADYETFFDELNTNGSVRQFESRATTCSGKKVWTAIFARLDEYGVVEGTAIDIEQRKQSEKELDFLAHHDPLTELQNRKSFQRELDAAFAESKRSNAQHVLLFIDLDQFKIVNDTCGHHAGDELLRQLAMRFRAQVRGEDALARLGGDEFALLLRHCTLPAGSKIAEQLRDDVANFRFVWDSKTFTLGVSVGVAPIDGDTESVEQAVSLADTACYAAKDAGRNRVLTYSGESDGIQFKRSEMERVQHINRALEHDDFVLYFQTIAPTNPDHNHSFYYEVLVRMVRDGDIVPPGAFLPAAERYNKIVDIDLWVVRNYLKWLEQHPQHLQELRVATLNLSGGSISNPSFASQIKQIMSQSSVDPRKLCFEITESMAISNLTDTLKFIRDMHALGISFSLDDFGSGFSSYGYLRQLPIQNVKIDGSFIKDMATDPVSQAMVRSIIDIAHTMELDVIAEFVENQQLAEMLDEMGVNYLQGYHIAKPAPLTRFVSTSDAGEG